MLLAFGSMLVVSGVAWGSLLQRVRTLEREVAALSGFAELLARIDERTLNIAKSVDDIKGSWVLTDPPRYSNISRPVEPGPAR